MQQYDAILCWCNNLMQCCGVTRVQSDPWYSCFLSFHETQRSKDIQKNEKQRKLSWPLLGLQNLFLPLPLNLFNYHLHGFLKVIFPPKKFLKVPISHLNIKTFLQTNFYKVSKFAEHLQHFSDIDGFLKQIWPVRIFLNWCFHHKNSLI